MAAHTVIRAGTSEGSDDDGDEARISILLTAAAVICATRAAAERPDASARVGGGQDRERHAGNREHHRGGRDRRTATAAMAARPCAIATGTAPTSPRPTQPDDTAPDQVS